MRSLSTVHSPVGVIPQLVYVPAASGTPHMYVFNEGNSTAYIGGPGVNTVNGLALVPNQNVQVNIAYGTVYAVGGFYANGTATTSLNAATTIGGTAFTVGAGAGLQQDSSSLLRLERTTRNASLSAPVMQEQSLPSTRHYILTPTVGQSFPLLHHRLQSIASLGHSND